MLPLGIKLKSISLLLLIVGIMASSTIFLTGCDGFLGIRGTVYEWVDAPSDSKGEIIIDQDVPEGRLLQPIDNVTVWFGFQGMPAEESGRRFHPPSVTDSDGKFSGGWVVAPRKSTYTIRIDHDGYYPLVKDFTHNGGSTKEQIFNILLVRNQE
jgi:hypothetical protein